MPPAEPSNVKVAQRPKSPKSPSQFHAKRHNLYDFCPNLSHVGTAWDSLWTDKPLEQQGLAFCPTCPSFLQFFRRAVVINFQRSEAFYEKKAGTLFYHATTDAKIFYLCDMIKACEAEIPA
jgi:hypothetical protein